MSTTAEATEAGTLTVAGTVHVGRSRAGRKDLRDGPAPPAPPPGRVPRVARLMALAIKLDGLVRTGAVRDYAAVARLGHVTRARVSQVMAQTLLAPDLQEALLFLPPVAAGREPLTLKDLLPVAAVRDWRGQRRAWTELAAGRGAEATRPGKSD